jgi:hypothetical protein
MVISDRYQADTDDEYELLARRVAPGDGPTAQGGSRRHADDLSRYEPDEGPRRGSRERSRTWAYDLEDGEIEDEEEGQLEGGAAQQQHTAAAPGHDATTANGSRARSSADAHAAGRSSSKHRCDVQRGSERAVGWRRCLAGAGGQRTHRQHQASTPPRVVGVARCALLLLGRVLCRYTGS